jgi:hypothetical protein
MSYMTEDEMTHAQLLDETAPTIDSLRRTIRIARQLAVHMNRTPNRYDHALLALGELESELKYLVQEEIEAEKDEGAA